MGGPGRPCLALLPVLLACILSLTTADDELSPEEAAIYQLYDSWPQLVGPSLEEQSLMESTTEEVLRQRDVEARVAESLKGPRNHSWWEGELTGMLSRRILALNDAKVVLCYTHKEGGCCRAAVLPLPPDGAAGAEQENAEESSDSPASTPEAETDAASTSSGLLPAMPWGDTALFELPSGGTLRLEIERLDDSRFVVCYQRAADSVVACSVGLIDRKEGLRPFVAPLELGPGHLVSISIAAAGRRFSVCAQPLVQEGSVKGAASCRWAQVAGGSAVTPKWTKDKAISPMKNY